MPEVPRPPMPRSKIQPLPPLPDGLTRVLADRSDPLTHSELAERLSDLWVRLDATNKRWLNLSSASAHTIILDYTDSPPLYVERTKLLLCGSSSAYPLYQPMTLPSGHTVGTFYNASASGVFMTSFTLSCDAVQSIGAHLWLGDYSLVPNVEARNV